MIYTREGENSNELVHCQHAYARLAECGFLTMTGFLQQNNVQCEIILL